MATPKILVLVLAINLNPWERIEKEGQQTTWRNSAPDGIRIFRYIGTSPQSLIWKFLDKLWFIDKKIQLFTRGKVSIFSINFAISRRKWPISNVDFNNSEIITSVPDLYSFIGAKTLDAFDISIQEFEFDYIYRTNVSSYLDLIRLQKFVEDKPTNDFYAGLIGNHQGINFASGSGYFISRDLVIRVLQNRDLWDHNLVDDVSLGKLLTQEFNVGIKKVERADIESSDFNLKRVIDNPLNVFHYRCKAENPNTTIQIMNTLHRIISNQ